MKSKNRDSQKQLT